MFIGWLLFGLFLGFFAAAIAMAHAPDAIAHMREYIEIHNDYLEASRDLRNARSELKKENIVFCCVCEKEMTIDEARKVLERIIALAEKK